MTNADKYLKDGVDVEELTNGILEYNEQNRNCTFYENMRSFWKAEIKPTLTEDEKVILRNIRGLESIYRSTGEDGDLRVTCIECKGYISEYWINAFNHLFQFIKPRRRI